MILKTSVMISYGQILVFSSDLPRPGLLWTDAHGAQGFAYAPGIVSFGVPDHDGQCLLQVDIVDEIRLTKNALWAICVPFTVHLAPLIAGVIGQPNRIRIKPNKYNMVFEILPASNLHGRQYFYTLRILFCPSKNADFAILKFGYGLTSKRILKKDAEYA